MFAILKLKDLRMRRANSLGILVVVLFSSALARQSVGLIEAVRAGRLASVNALLAKG